MRLTFALTSLLMSCIAAILLVVSSCNKINLDPLPPTKDTITPLPTPPNLVGHPNIIVILADDIGYEVPKFNGGQSYQTPSLDAMATSGLRFTNCFAMASSSPSRFMLTTGKYNFRNYTNWGVMNPTETTVANILHNAGYTTCVSGKWQFDGGDASIKSLGYDKYCVWDAFKTGDEEEAEFGTSYKDPSIYQDGGYLGTDSVLTGSYGVDVFNQYVTDFIDNNKSNPFFIYYPIPIAHEPFSPVPGDPKYAAWVSKRGRSDTSFYPSMVNYMDKAIGDVINKVKADGLESKTVILFVSDNGTPSSIVSTYKNRQVTGGMGTPNIYGTHVPMLAYCPGSVTTGTCSSFIDFTDFLPTIVGLANTQLPAGFVTDGQTFRNQLFKSSFPGRTYLYSYFFPHPESTNSLQREYVQDTVYKYYDNGYGFFNIATDPYEVSKLSGAALTEDQQRLIGGFRKVIDSIHP